MDTLWPSWFVPLLRGGAGIGVGVGLLLTVRWISRVSQTAGLIVGSGMALKAATAGLLFWIPFLRLPLLRDHYTADGFWYLAYDARRYYLRAASAAAEGLQTIDWRAPAPGYIRSLALAIELFGESPATAILLNLMAYAATCALLTAVLLTSHARLARPAGLIALTAVTFSPLLFLSGTQPLKEEVFCTGMVLTMTGAAVLLPELVRERTSRSCRRLGFGLAALWMGIYVVSGIRPYYPIFIWAALAGTFGVCVGTQRPCRLPAFASGATVILALLWGAFVLGSGPEYYRYYTGKVWAVVSGTADSEANLQSSDAAVSPTRWAGNLVTELDGDRDTFISRAGGTNWVSRSSADTSAADKLKSTVTGLLLLLVPASLLNGLSVVDFTGGQGLLVVTDVDTLFQDAIFLALIAVLLKRRETVRANLPFVVFTSLLAASVALSLAYVVVNYGTLFRLRLLVTLPLWMMALAASNERPMPKPVFVQPHGPDASGTGQVGR